MQSALLPNHILVAASTIISKAILALTQILTIRLLLTSIGVESYAAFTLLSSLTAWAALADLGVSNSMHNYISEMQAEKRDDASIRLNAFYLIAASIIACLILVMVFGNTISEIYLKNIIFLNPSEKKNVFIVAMIIFILNTSGFFVQRMWFAEQRGWISNILPVAGALLGVSGLIIFKLHDYSNPLMASIVVFYLPLTIISIATFIIVYWNQKKSNINPDIKIILSLLKRGKGFWLFSLFATLASQADYIVLSQIMSAKDIYTYSILQKIFMINLVGYVAFLQALWPVFVNLRIEMEFYKIRKMAHKYIIYGCFSVLIITTILVYLNKEIFELLGYQEDINSSLILLFGLYIGLRIWADTYTTILQSMNILFPFWILVPAQAFITLICQFYLGLKFGLNGILEGLIVGSLLTGGLFYPAIFYRQVKATNKYDPIC